MMYDFVVADENSVFLIAIIAVMLLALLEGVFTLIGAGLSQFLDSLLPADIGDVDFDLETGGAGLDFSSSILAWLRIGKVPMIISLILFLVSFGLVGLVLQYLVVSIFTVMLPSIIAVIPVFFAAIFCMGVGNAAIGAIMPKSETSAVSTDTFIGRVAVVTLGTASVGSPAQAKLHDEHNQVHYVMVEPDQGIGDIQQGEKLLLIEKVKANYRGILPDGILSD